MTDHVLRQFTAARLSTVEQDWRALAGDDEFDSELAPMFSWCASHIDHQDGDSQALELYEPTREKTDAVLEVVKTRRGAMSKLLKLYVSPEFWDAEGRKDLIAQITDLHAAAYEQVLRTGMATEGVREVKIYGRTDLMFSLLKRVHDGWNPDLGWSTQMQGRWLAISLGERG